MIETEQSVAIAAPLEAVWDYVRDISRWAALMPGMREFTVIDDDNSRWVLKVGVGGLVRTVTVNVRVDEWAGPARAVFAYDLVGDPVDGGGTYRAVALSPSETEITLALRVNGKGPMAPMWEAMGRPLLPQLARGFAGQLKEAIEAHVGENGAMPAAEAPAGWLKRLWCALFGR